MTILFSILFLIFSLPFLKRFSEYIVLLVTAPIVTKANKKGAE